MRVAQGCLQAVVPQKGLDVPDICSALQQVRGIAVPQAVDAAPLVNACTPLGFLEHFLCRAGAVGFATLSLNWVKRC